ncbi:MAG: hypothetical protein WBA74_25650, partial [Cyclobacteriaceae bacterium]
MKNIAFATVFLFSSLLFSCGPDTSETDSVTYELPPTSEHNISGKLIISKNSDGTATINLQLENTIKGFEYPTHLHYGNLGVEDAEVA